MAPDPDPVPAEITNEFCVIPVCNNQVSTFYFADLSGYVGPSGVQSTVFFRWANEILEKLDVDRDAE